MAEAGAGNAGAGGQGDAGKGAGDGAAGAGGQGDAGKGAAPAWHGYTEQADIDYVATKGWQGPADAVKSYRSAEKLIGRNPDQLLVLPRADDPDGTRAVLAKLGLPEKPDAYDMKVGLPKDAQVNEDFAKSMQGMLHKAGITTGQAKQLVSDWNAMSLAQQTQASKDYELNVQADKQLLLDEWKGGHDRMMNRAKTAATALGFTGELIDAVEQKLGYAKTYKMFAEIGGKLGEDTFVGAGEKTGGFGATLTPAEAKTQLAEMRADLNHVKAMMDKSHPGHKLAQEKENKLFAIMYPSDK